MNNKTQRIDSPNHKSQDTKENSDSVDKVSEEGFQDITLFKNPIQSSYTLICIIIEQFKSLIFFLQKNFLIPLFFIIYLILVSIKEGPHREFIDNSNKILYFCVYWILLGIASSVGFGTGLHTFVLYLGPHIAKVTLAANECAVFPEMYPNKWEFKDFVPCSRPSSQTESNSLWTIFINIQLEAFLWGVGTAIGELPPYYMARAARISGKTLEEIDELNNIESHYDEMPFIEKAKYFVCSRLKTHGFIIVLLAASIPNPLFDLAGITCGHFLVPFSTFFGATFIGKALIKVTIQSIFVIVTFSEHHVEYILNFLESNLPFLHGSLSKTLEKQKHLLWHSEKKEEIEDRPLIAVVWEYVITLMIIYFLVSIINSLVNSKRKKDYEENKNKKNK